MRVAIDIDGTITRCPVFFSIVSRALLAAGHQVYIISHRADRGFAEEDLAEHAIAYDELVLPSEEALFRITAGNWKEEVGHWKAEACRNLKIDLFFDDMPEVLNALPGTTAAFMAVDSSLGRVAYGPKE